MYVVIATSHTRYINDTYVLGQVVLLLQQIHPIGMSGAVWKTEHCREVTAESAVSNSLVCTTMCIGFTCCTLIGAE